MDYRELIDEVIRTGKPVTRTIPLPVSHKAESSLTDAVMTNFDEMMETATSILTAVINSKHALSIPTATHSLNPEEFAAKPDGQIREAVVNMTDGEQQIGFAAVNAEIKPETQTAIISVTGAQISKDDSEKIVLRRTIFKTPKSEAISFFGEDAVKNAIENHVILAKSITTK